MQTYTIGRSHSCDITILGENSISRKHASIVEIGTDQFQITDLSINGTFLKKSGKWIRFDTAILKTDEAIMLGQFETSVGGLVEQLDGATDELNDDEIEDPSTPTQQMTGQLRLSAIVTVDLCRTDYLIQQSETAVLHKLVSLVSKEMLPIIVNRGGQVIESAGDGFIAEFPIAANAAKAAVETQNYISIRNQNAPEHQIVQFRCGANVGDVLARDDGIFGSAVNLTYKLCAKSRPGGVCISGTLWQLLPKNQQKNFINMDYHYFDGHTRAIRIFEYYAKQ